MWLKKNFFLLFLALYNCIEDSLITNISFRIVLRALFKMFWSRLIVGNNLFAIHIELITFILTSQKQLCLSEIPHIRCVNTWKKKKIYSSSTTIINACCYHLLFLINIFFKWYSCFISNSLNICIKWLALVKTWDSLNLINLSTTTWCEPA